MDDNPQSGNQHQASPPAETQGERRQSDQRQTRAELNEAISGSQEILATATTIHPFYPDSITVDRAKMTVNKRRFVASASTMSMSIEDVLNVTNSVGPLFGSVTIVSRVLNSRPLTVGRFWRKDALRIKRVAQGYIIALQREIDCSSMPADELARKLYELGEDEHTA
jgi:hypothetical protein